MKRRVRKLKRIARYYEQQRDIHVVRLRRAGMERMSQQKKLESLFDREKDYTARRIGMLSGLLNTGQLALAEGGVGYFRENISRQKGILEKAIHDESEKRDTVLKASLKCRIWEKVVDRGEEALSKSETVKNEKISDDLAILHSHSGELR